MGILKDGADFGRNELSLLCFQYGDVLLFPAFEVDDPETVDTTDICFIALWSDDQGVERVVLFEQLFPCPVLGIKVEESSFAAVA